MNSVPGKKTTVTIKYPASTTSDGMGNPLITWATKWSGKGKLVSLSGDERFVGGQATVIASHLLLLPYNSTTSTITEKMKAEIGTRTFNILWVENPGLLNHHIELRLLEVI